MPLRSLYLMRHGSAEPSSPGGDAARELTGQGRAVVERAGAGLAHLGVKVDAVWHSPYRRATQTAEVVGAALGCRRLVEKPELVPHGVPEQAADELRVAQGSILVASHLPFLPALVSELLGAPVQVNFHTATVVHLEMLGHGAACLSGMWPAALLARSTPS